MVIQQNVTETDPSENIDNTINACKDLRAKTQGPEIVVAQINVRSLLRNINEVKLLLQHTHIDLLSLTETHLTDRIDDCELHIDGYEIKRSDRKGREGGGVAIYLRIT